MRTLWLAAIFAFVLLCPTGDALSFAVGREAHTYRQAADTMAATLQSEVRVAEGTTDSRGPNVDGVMEFFIPIGVTGFTATYQDRNRTEAVPSSNIQKSLSSHATFELYRINVSAYQQGLGADDSFNVTLSYHVEAIGLKMRTRYASTFLVVLAEAQPGFSASSKQLGNFIPINETHAHAVRAQAPAGFEYEFIFLPTEFESETADFTNYAWGVAGFLVGLVFAYAAVRQGWFGPAKAKRFVKGGQMESRPMLEARRRTLMAALKELEGAHDAKEVPDDVHGVLKEEYKAQAVRVMRSLEEKKEEPKG